MRSAISRRYFLTKIGMGTRAAALSFAILDDPNKVGGKVKPVSGTYTYELAPDWGRLPASPHRFWADTRGRDPILGLS